MDYVVKFAEMFGLKDMVEKFLITHPELRAPPAVPEQRTIDEAIDYRIKAKFGGNDDG